MATEKMVPLSEAVKATRQLDRIWALVHYHYAKTLIKELGQDEGERIMRKALYSFGYERGAAQRRAMESQGLEATPENVLSNAMGDLPSLGRVQGSGWQQEPLEPPHKGYLMTIPRCELAKTWSELGAPEIGWIYCSVVDQAKYDGCNPSVKLEHVKNLCRGDDCCVQRVYIAESEEDKSA